jgi:mono/diheme cytochrome c family protein
MGRIVLGVFVVILTISCVAEYQEPQISLEEYKIEEGFNLEVLASEPLLNAPVAMDFDRKGRIWVTEMNSYMANLEGQGENEPVGKIKILEDKDQDGVMDHAKVFLDSLVLPRAIALVYDGLLYAEPPYLWFVEIDEHDNPKSRVLVDSLYAATGNPEHQPNGLLLNVDNWIYNAKSHFRYRRKNGKWLKEPTSFRGQWGITHDAFGRLYYNDNSRQLLGDYVLPNVLIRNKFLRPKHGVNKLLTQDQRVYPLHATLVNRGYAQGVLDKDSMLVNVTAACGPLVYQGSAFPSDYEGNVFVSVPEANLIKRNIITFYGDSIAAKQAWEGREFLASTDEGFRPVNISNGPDGALYIVDMHRGLIGHHAYLSPYFKELVEKSSLEEIVNQGRILKVTHKKAESAKQILWNELDNESLVQLLESKNGWIRKRAQHLLIEKRALSVEMELMELLTSSLNPYSQIHALYVLEGLNILSLDRLLAVVDRGGAPVASHALCLLDVYANPENVRKYVAVMQNVLNKADKGLHFYAMASLGRWMPFASQEIQPIFKEFRELYSDNPIFNEAFVSGLGTDLQNVRATLSKNLSLKDSGILRLLDEVSAKQRNNERNRIFVETSLKEDPRTKGAKIFRNVCAACHGINGEGNEGLAPPLVGSDYVAQPIERLGLILLHGLKGPVHVNGVKYEMNQAMPGLKGNESLSDKDIADVITYVSNAFANIPQGISGERVSELRSMVPPGGGEYTEEALLQINFN